MGALRLFPFRFCLLKVLLLLFVALPSRADEVMQAPQVLAIDVNGRSVPFRDKDNVNLGPSAQNVRFLFGWNTNDAKPPLRMRYLLEGYEDTWHEARSDMSLNVRFYNDAGDQINQTIYGVSGESTGWTGSLKTSSLTHRRETLVVPPQATRLLIVISSAGPPDTVGIYVVANLVVSKSSGKSAGVVLMQSPFEADHVDPANDDVPSDWIRDGISPSMAKVVKFGQDPQTKAFAIVDEDRTSHAEWHNLLVSAPKVTPGDTLVVEWNEMYSVGSGSFHETIYPALVAKRYKFRVRGLDVMGRPTGAEAAVSVFVSEPFWKTPWFWGILVVAITAGIMGISRYFVWQRMRREVARLEQQRELEQERLRIAHDIHDDLGARITQISLLSAMSQGNAAFPEKARVEFDKVSKMSRELVLALYETVWAVNPENDNLEALGNYVCRMVKQLCENTALRCRFYVRDLPAEVQVSSQTRHNISMAIKEAVHNIIKHSNSPEIIIHMEFSQDVLNVSVQDSGSGFEAGMKGTGHGLSNMKQRLEKIGGTCTVESLPGQGTTVRMRLNIPSAVVRP
jgi:signal transduction histidine kinase